MSSGIHPLVQNPDHVHPITPFPVVHDVTPCSESAITITDFIECTTAMWIDSDALNRSSDLHQTDLGLIPAPTIHRVIPDR